MMQWQFGKVYEIKEYFDRLVVFYENEPTFEVHECSELTLHQKYIKFNYIKVIKDVGYEPPNELSVAKGTSAILMPVDEKRTKKIYNFIQTWIKARQKQIKKESK